MDNLTQTAAGLMLSRAGLNRLTPQATAILLLAANAPDIDVLSMVGGAVSYLGWRRGLSHSVMALPLLALLCVLLVRGVSRKPVKWGGAIAAAAIGVALHLLLDATNGYGVRLLAPFSAAFYRLEWTAEVDLWIWALLLLALAAPFLGRLVGGEITSSSRRPAWPGRGWPIFALTFLLLYNGARGVLHERAIGELESRIYEQETPLRVAAVPNAVNPLRWNGVVETTGAFVLPEVNLAADFDALRARVLHKSAADDAMASARRTPAFRVFLAWAEFPLWLVTPDESFENGKLVSVAELRFAGWSASALEDSRGQVRRSWAQIGSLH